MTDADRRLTVAYVMNKLVPCMIVGSIAAALVEPLYEFVNRLATRSGVGPKTLTIAV